MPNPYISRGPLRQPEMFYGRQEELREIAAFLRGGQSVALFGPSEIGKTSLLFHLMRPATRLSLELGETFLFTYIDCEILGRGGPDSILGQIAAEVAFCLGEVGQPAEPALEEVIQRPSRLSFEAAIRKLNERGLHTILLLDEFEQLSANPDLDLQFFNLLGSAAVRYGLIYLIASDRPMAEFDKTRTNPTQTLLTSPFFTLFAVLFLGLLPETEARRLICEPSEREGVPFPAETQNFIYELVGGHPEALQIACFHAFGKPESLPGIEQSILEELDSHFEATWIGLTSSEQDTLIQLHTLNTHNGDTTMRSRLRGLAQKCLLVYGEHGYNYPSRAWANFVDSQIPKRGPIAASVPATGWRFGPYEILEPLGRGGMADVYNVRHTRLDRPVAIKILPARMAEEEDFRERFEREARAVAALRHPNIVQVYDFGDVEENFYIIMEYIQGKDLGKLIKEAGSLSLTQALPILRDLGSALDYAHARGVVHRDIKPSNALIQVTADDRPSTAVSSDTSAVGSQSSAVCAAFLTDFGIAKILGSDTSSATQTGLMMGTLSYMAPEQIRSAAGVDARADIYSLGVVLYQMLTGKLPFQADNPGTVMLKHLTEAPPDPLDLRPDLPVTAAEAVLRCMAKEPGERFASAGELVAAIEAGA